MQSLVVWLQLLFVRRRNNISIGPNTNIGSDWLKLPKSSVFSDLTLVTCLLVDERPIHMQKALFFKNTHVHVDRARVNSNATELNLIWCTMLS